MRSGLETYVCLCYGGSHRSLVRRGAVLLIQDSLLMTASVSYPTVEPSEVLSFSAGFTRQHFGACVTVTTFLGVPTAEDDGSPIDRKRKRDDGEQLEYVESCRHR
jgi:hypothetical protein